MPRRWGGRHGVARTRHQRCWGGGGGAPFCFWGGVGGEGGRGGGGGGRGAGGGGGGGGDSHMLLSGWLARKWWNRLRDSTTFSCHYPVKLLTVTSVVAVAPSRTYATVAVAPPASART